MFGVIEELLKLAREALAARGDQQRIDEIEAEVVTLRRELNALKDYRERREVEDQAQLLLGRDDT